MSWCKHVDVNIWILLLIPSCTWEGIGPVVVISTAYKIYLLSMYQARHEFKTFGIRLSFVQWNRWLGGMCYVQVEALKNMA